jgi:hypothetical protein
MCLHVLKAALGLTLTIEMNLSPKAVIQLPTGIMQVR